MYIILLLIIILISIFQVIYKYCEKIKIYKNVHFHKNINILLIGGTHGNEPAGSYVLEILRKQLWIKIQKELKHKWIKLGLI